MKSRIFGGHRLSEDLIAWSEQQATHLLPVLGNRWLHILRVVEVAMHITYIFSEEEHPLLIAAAYLHDIGYASSLAKTGIHPIDGANYVAQFGLPRLASIIAHHTGFRFTASLIHAQDKLAAFPYEHSLVTCALTYCDLHSGPTGQPFTLQERLDDIVARYGRSSPVTRSFIAALPTFKNDIAIVERRLKRCRYTKKR